jgi:hypothetical protein
MTTPQIPDCWSPEQALAIYTFLDDLRDHIWNRYGLRIQQLCACNHLNAYDPSQPDLFDPEDPDNPLPF